MKKLIFAVIALIAFNASGIAQTKLPEQRKDTSKTRVIKKQQLKTHSANTTAMRPSQTTTTKVQKQTTRDEKKGAVRPQEKKSVAVTKTGRKVHAKHHKKSHSVAKSTKKENSTPPKK